VWFNPVSGAAYPCGKGGSNCVRAFRCVTY
jgi:hypothetical protein